MPEKKKKSILKSKGKSGGLLMVLGGAVQLLSALGVPVESVVEVSKAALVLGGGLGLWGIRDAMEEE